MIKNLLTRIWRKISLLVKYFTLFRLKSSQFKDITGGFFFIPALLATVLFVSLKPEKPVIEGRNPQIIRHTPVNPEEAIKILDQQTPLELVYNEQVGHYINLFTGERKDQTEIIIGRSKLYFPIIESYLDNYGLPLELKYIAVVESGLNPKARSKSGAVGLWQFLYNTCDLLSLKTNSYIDERQDVIKSTDAACRYLQYLYRTFNDWNLVLAAYNGGPGEVRKAIERSGGITDYWKLRPFLSNQAANYVSTFIAYNYVFNFYRNHKLTPPKPGFLFKETDTIWMKQPVSMEMLSKCLKIPKTQLEFLNPVYKTDYIPVSNGYSILILPENKISAFLKHEKMLYNYSIKPKNYIELVSEAGSTENRSCIKYLVQNGDYFHKIAMQYNCTIENIKAWNNLDSNDLSPGQELNIWIEKED